jgi:nucleotide-binding universal stress UspA family protein
MRERVILVGTDLGARGDDAIVEGLTELATSKTSRLHVIYVQTPTTLRAGLPLLVQEEQVLRDGPLALQRRIQYDAVLNGVPYAPARIQTHVMLGDPVQTLLQACVDFEADLLILGAHGRHGLQHLVLGSVVKEMLRRAHCPVLVARPKNYHGLTEAGLPPPAPH